MRKKLLSLLALTLILTMTLPLFAACGDGEQGTDADTKAEQTTSGEPTSDSGSVSLTETEAAVFPEVEQQDYDADFFMHIMADSNRPEYHWVEESRGDTMSEAVYNRQEQVRRYLGVEIFSESSAGHSLLYIDTFKTAVKNKDDSVQLFLSHVYGGLSGLITEGYLTDFNNLPGVNTEADYWSAEIMEDLAVEGRMYMGYSRYNILNTHVITFNKEMMEKYGDSLGSSVYDMVDNYEWTLDRMIYIANLAYVDTTSDGKTPDDTFGITGNIHTASTSFLQAADIQLVEQDDTGAYKFSVYNELNAERTVTLLDKLKDLFTSEVAWVNDQFHNPVQHIPLHTGRSLMCIMNTNDLPKLCEYELTFGVLPFPMYDEEQKDVGYRHLKWGGQMVVPSYLANPQMVGETLEMLSFFSAAVNEAFYEKLLGKQASDLPEDRKVLALVWDTICSDFGQSYCSLTDGDILNMVPIIMASGKDTSIVTMVAANEKNFNKLFEKFVKSVQKQK